VTIKKTAIIASLLIAGSCLSCGVQAAQLGTYVGGGVGYSKRDFNRDALDAFRDTIVDQLGYTTLEQGPITAEDAGFGYWATLGYRATAHWAFEGSYSQLSSLSYKSTAAQGYSTVVDFSQESLPLVDVPGPATLKFDAEDNALQLDALFIVPRGYRWEFYGRGGVVIGSLKSKFSFDSPGGRAKGEASDSYTSYHVGVGFSYSLLEVYGLRFEYIHSFSLGTDRNALTAKHDVDSIALAVVVSF
jgi:opacity protein-like surface antigen